MQRVMLFCAVGVCFVFALKAYYHLVGQTAKHMTLSLIIVTLLLQGSVHLQWPSDFFEADSCI